MDFNLQLYFRVLLRSVNIELADGQACTAPEAVAVVTPPYRLYVLP